MAERPASDFVALWRQIAIVCLPVAAILVAIALLWMADEAHYRGCLAKADLKYPAVPVSAFVGASHTNVGPVKVSYAAERIAAANGCHHL